MDKLYRKLFQDVTKDELFEEQLTKPLMIPYLTSFTTIVGKDYEENKFRFMLVGRAVNGWSEKRIYEECLTEEEFVNSSIDNYNNEKETFADNEKKRFEWIANARDENATPTNCYRKGIDSSETLIKKEPYRLSSPFWNYSKDVWCKLNGSDEKSAWYNKWYNNIIWTNLYRIAPTFGGNPNEKIKEAQFNACFELLKTEIKQNKPTHILFLTGYEGWYDRFDREFKKYTNDIGGYSFKSVKNDYIEAYGSINDAKFVVAKRPELKNKDKFVKEVVKIFNN